MTPYRTVITRHPIQTEELTAFVADHAHGAQILFVGVIRNAHDGRKVRGVTYDAFEPLACKILREISAEAARQWNCRVAAVHRLGRLKVGEVSVVVAVGAPHRAEAFTASRFVINEIKRRLPVWKKEHYLDGTSSWLGGSSLRLTRV